MYQFTRPGCGANYLGKAERTLLYEQCVEHAWSDQSSIVKNHFNQCVDLQYLLNNTSLSPAFFPNDNSIGSADNRNSHINIVIDNTNTIDNIKHNLSQSFV